MTDERAMRGRSDLGRSLGALEGAGMIELVATDPDPEYLFRHVLIQDAAYASLLRQERRRLHLVVADCLESMYPERLDELAPVLAMHLETAGEIDRSVDYLVRAGESALRRFALHEARDALDRARGMLEDGDRVEAETRRRRARIDLLRIESGFTFTPASTELEILRHVRDDAEALGDEGLLARAFLLTALVRTAQGDQVATSVELREALDRGLELAERTGDMGHRAEALALRGETHHSSAAYEDAIRDLEEATVLFETSGRLDRASMAVGTAALAHGRLGRFDTAEGLLERSNDLARRSGDPNAILDVDLVRAIVAALQGRSDEAIDLATRAAAAADAVDNKACGIVARSVIGEQRMLQGRPDLAVAVLEESADLAEYCDLAPSRIEFTRALLDSARTQCVGQAIVPDRLERAMELARVSGDRLGEGEILRQRARDRLRCHGPTDGALDDFAGATELFDSLGARPDLLKTLDEHAVALRAAGRADQAEAVEARAAGLRSSMISYV